MNPLVNSATARYEISGSPLCHKRCRKREPRAIRTTSHQMNTFSVLFLLALAIATGTRLWLARRHVSYIRGHRDAVPADFAPQITLEAHQKAADYSSLRTRFGMVHTVIDAAILLVLTFGGLLQAFDT